MQGNQHRPRKGLLILGIVVFALVVAGIAYIAYWLWCVFSGLQKELLVAIIASSSTIFVSVLTVTMGKYLERKLAIDKEIREKKIPVYDEFLEFYFRVVNAVNYPELAATEKETAEFMREFTRKLLLWGSDDVMVKWSALRSTLSEVDTKDQKQSIAMFVRFEDLMLAIRRDTGHANKGIERGDILGLFINDIKAHI